MPFACKGCSKQFTTDGNLYSHIFSGCKGGKKCFNCGEHLMGKPRWHMLQNHKDYPCSICVKRFFLMAAVNSHTAMKHGAALMTGPRSREEEHQRDSELRLSGEKQRLMGEVVRGIQNTVQHNSGLPVHNVYKSGSVKKGTALDKNADIDLVLFCNTDKNVVEFAETKEEYFKQLCRMVSSGAFNWTDSVMVTGQNSEHLELSLTYRHTRLKVDFTVSRNPPTDHSEKAMRARFDAMKLESKKTQKQFNYEYTQQQTDVIRVLPPKVKDLIREMKDWKTTNDVPVKSYFLELLVKYNWEKMGGEPSFNRDMLRRRVFTDLIHVSTMRITDWEDAPRSYRQFAENRPPPLLTDPVNPLDNVAPSAEDAGKVARAARSEYLGIY